MVGFHVNVGHTHLSSLFHLEVGFLHVFRPFELGHVQLL